MALITVHLNFSDREKWHTAMRLMKYISMPKEIRRIYRGIILLHTERIELITLTKKKNTN